MKALQHVKRPARKATLALLTALLALCVFGCSSRGANPGSDSKDTAQQSQHDQPESDESAQPANETSPSQGIIQVEVVDTVVESTRSGDETHTATSTYEYDEAGRLATITTANPSLPKSGSKQTFYYDDSNRPISVVSSVEAYDWADGSQESYTYDEQGNCVSYRSEVLTQGDGGSIYEFSYDNSGRPISGSNVDYNSGETYEKTLTWTYTPEGVVASYLGSESTYPNIRLVSSEAEQTAGIYEYASSSNAGTSTTRLYFSSDGKLEQEEWSNGSTSTSTVYTYKVIAVDAATYLPTIFSNPTGLTIPMKPQLSASDIAAIKGQ